MNGHQSDLPTQSQNNVNKQKSSEAIQRAYDTLISPRTGIISHVYTRPMAASHTPFWTAGAQTAETSRYPRTSGRLTPGSGIGLTENDALISAVGEAIERYAVCFYDPDIDITWSTYNDVAEIALNPADFATLSEREYAQFPQYHQFDPNKPIGWTQGHLLGTDTPVFAPALFVYSGYNMRYEHECISPIISTGWATGPSWHWAVLRGICECIERDAFMITYLNRLHVPEIVVHKNIHPTIHTILDRVDWWQHCKLRAWNITLDIPVPTIVAAVQSSSNTEPALAFGAATHPDPITALGKALLEAIHSWLWVRDSVYPHYYDRVFAPDWSDVLKREDHLGLAAQPDYQEHLSWLLSPQETIDIYNIPTFPGNTTEEQLSNIISALQQVGLTGAVFDVTTPDVRQAGFHVASVLIPELQQLMFGSIRMLGGKRLYQLPWRLGYIPQPTTEDNLNPIPHPFP